MGSGKFWVGQKSDHVIFRLVCISIGPIYMWLECDILHAYVCHKILNDLGYVLFVGKLDWVEG